MSGNILLNANMDICGNLGVSGEFEVDDNVSFNNNLNVSGDLNVTGNVTLNNITNDELNYLSGVTLDIQDQLDEKQDTITTTNRLDANKIGNNTNVSNTEYGYLSGVTSDIQDQLDEKASLNGATFTGNVNIDRTGNAQLNIFASANKSATINMASAGNGSRNVILLHQNAANPSSSTDYLYIDYNGSFADGVAVKNKLTVTQEVVCNGLTCNGYIGSTNSSGGQGYVSWSSGGDGNHPHQWRFGWHAGTYAEVQFKNLAGDNNINLYVSGVLMTSDDRLKINEKLIENATETLMKLRPQIYDKYLNMDCSGITKPEAGLIAQEVHYQAPELRKYIISYPYDISINDIQDIDINNINIQNDPDYELLGWGNKEASINYISLIPWLIKSNQEQQEEIDALKTKNTTLESELSDIKTRILALETN